MEPICSKPHSRRDGFMSNFHNLLHASDSRARMELARADCCLGAVLEIGEASNRDKASGRMDQGFPVASCARGAYLLCSALAPRVVQKHDAMEVPSRAGSPG